MYNYSYVKSLDACGRHFMNHAKSNKKVHMIAGIVALALLLYASITLISIKAKAQQAEEQKVILEQKVEEIQEQNKQLQYQIDHSDSDETIKDIARAKLGLVEPGEIIFYDESN